MDKGIEAGSTEHVDKAKGLVGSLPGRGREVKKNWQAGEGDAGKIEEHEVEKSGNAAETEDRLVFFQLDREEEDFGEEANKLAHLWQILTIGAILNVFLVACSHNWL